MKLNAIGIVSKDLQASIKFYEKLGVRFEPCEKEAMHADAMTESGLRLMLDSEDIAKQMHPDWKRPNHYSISLAFDCSTPAQVDACFKQMIDSGYKFKKEPFDAVWGQRYAVILDPDNNIVDLYAMLKA